MKFKELTPEIIDKARVIYNNKDMSWDDRMKDLCLLFGKCERTVRGWCSNKLDFKNPTINQVNPKQLEIAKSKELESDKKRFIITWAQNNTKINKCFLNNMLAYGEHINAQLLVIAGKYHNINSNENCDEIYWDKMIEPYLDANRHDIHKYVSIMSDVVIVPTAINPMSGLNGLSSNKSCIFGSPKIQLEMSAVLDNSVSKIMMTTGSVTHPNYTISKAGKKGEFHHTFGFIIVEIKDDDIFYARQVTANNDGSFTDLWFNVKNETVSIEKSIEGIVLGDLHCGNIDNDVLTQTQKLITNYLVPKNVVLHDVFDGYSINHHEIKDPFIQYSNEVNNRNSLSNEIDNLINVLKTFENFEKVIIVRSNHDDFLDRWLKDGDWKKQPTCKNSIEYMEYSAILLKQYANNDVIGIIPHIINEKLSKNFVCLKRCDSYKIKNWEVGQHGDLGANGSKGSIGQYRNLNTKLIIGHSHTPARKDGALSVGTTSKLRMSYNNGPSSWLHSHVIIHNDGKTQHLNFIKDNNGNVDFTTLYF